MTVDETGVEELDINLKFYSTICDLLSENLALPTISEFELEAILSIQVIRLQGWSQVTNVRIQKYAKKLFL